MRSIDIKNATPEQLELIRAVESLAWYAEPVSFVPLYFQGSIAGSEFVTYNANKLYICFSLSYGYHSSTAAYGMIELYGVGDVLTYVLNNQAPYWNATGAALNFVNPVTEAKNYYFSRINAAVISKMRFIGYRLTKL